MLKRIKNLWELSAYRPTEDGIQRVIKAKPRPATIVKDDPIDLFPEAEPELK